MEDHRLVCRGDEPGVVVCAIDRLAGMYAVLQVHERGIERGKANGRNGAVDVLESAHPVALAAIVGSDKIGTAGGGEGKGLVRIEIGFDVGFARRFACRDFGVIGKVDTDGSDREFGAVEAREACRQLVPAVQLDAIDGNRFAQRNDGMPHLAEREQRFFEAVRGIFGKAVAQQRFERVADLVDLRFVGKERAGKGVHSMGLVVTVIPAPNPSREWLTNRRPPEVARSALETECGCA